MAGLGQVEWSSPGALQARVPNDRAMLKVIFRRRTSGPKTEVQHKEGVEAGKRDNLAAFQDSVRRQQGHGN